MTDTPQYKNIKHPELAGKIWDWQPFDDCFGGKIRMGDIDGMVERNGYILLVETKHTGSEIPFGQMIMFNQLSKLPNFTVILIWGEINKPQQLQYVGQDKKQSVDIAGVKKHFKDWYDKVDKLPQYEVVKPITEQSHYEWIRNLPWYRLWKLYWEVKSLLDTLATSQRNQGKAA